MNISLEDQITCVRREIGMRESVYPRWVAAGRMGEVKAQRQLDAMKAVLETLEGLRQSESRLDTHEKEDELAEERAENWALWEFVHRHDEWLESSGQCGGTLFGLMVEARGNLASPKLGAHEEESE